MSESSKPNTLHSTVRDIIFNPYRPQTFTKISIDDFEVGTVLGNGSFGRVVLCRHIKSGSICAIKCLSKSNILDKGKLSHLLSEKKLLTSLKEKSTSGILSLLGSFQSEDMVYLISEAVLGGELSSLLRSKGKIPEDHAKFFIAELTLTLELLHKQGIAYRDLKAENILLDQSGHVKLIDFGFAKSLGAYGRSYTVCGTCHSMAPELIDPENKCGHGLAVDWWALGVLLYEILLGYSPFNDDSQDLIYDKILTSPVTFPIKGGPSLPAKDLIRKLLTRDASLRSGASEVKKHPWFRNFDWESVKKRKLVPPYKPTSCIDLNPEQFKGSLALVKPPLNNRKLTAAEEELFQGF